MIHGLWLLAPGQAGIPHGLTTALWGFPWPPCTEKPPPRCLTFQARSVSLCSSASLINLLQSQLLLIIGSPCPQALLRFHFPPRPARVLPARPSLLGGYGFLSTRTSNLLPPRVPLWPPHLLDGAGKPGRASACGTRSYGHLWPGCSRAEPLTWQEQLWDHSLAWGVGQQACREAPALRLQLWAASLHPMQAEGPSAPCLICCRIPALLVRLGGEGACIIIGHA